MNERWVVGYVEYAINVGLFITLDSGENRELFVDDIYRVVPHMPLNERLAVLVDDDWNVSNADVFYKQLEAPALRRTTDKRIAVANRNGEDPEGANNIAKNLANFWAQLSDGYWTVEGFGYALEESQTDCYQHSSRYCNTEMRTAFNNLPENEKPAWYPNYWHIIGGSPPPNRNVCGTATLGGSAGVTYSYCGFSTTAHELGHNFGLLHSNTEDKDGNQDEYADKSSIMGSHSSEGLHPPNAYYLGFYQQDEVRKITSNSQFIVCPWEMSKTMRAGNEKPFNIIEPGEDTSFRGNFFVSVRKQRGTPLGYKEGVLYIHKANSASWLLDEIGPGKESRVIPGVTVKHLKHENEVSLVEVIYDNDSSNPVPEVIQDEKFPEPENHSEVSEAHDGLWYNPKTNGQGFDIHIKNGRMNLYWYTYSEHGSLGDSLRWYIAECDLSNGPEVFDLYTVEDATFNDPSAGKVKQIGKGQFYCLDEKNGFFSFLTEVHGRGSFAVTKFADSNSSKDGSWYDPARNYEGFTFRFLDEGKRCIGFWYTHGLNNPYLGPAGREWYLLDGERQSDGSYLLQALSTSNQYKFQEYNLYDVDYKNAGQVKLTPDGDRFVFESDMKNRILKSKLQRIF